jgi:hypothetical protein
MTEVKGLRTAIVLERNKDKQTERRVRLSKLRAQQKSLVGLPPLTPSSRTAFRFVIFHPKNVSFEELHFVNFSSNT